MIHCQFTPCTATYSNLVQQLVHHVCYVQALFRRAQLKALVDIHSAAEGLGGTLTGDEISIIQGALDLTAKTAWRAMTALDKVMWFNNWCGVSV